MWEQIGDLLDQIGGWLATILTVTLGPLAGVYVARSTKRAEKEAAEVAQLRADKVRLEERDRILIDYAIALRRQLMLAGIDPAAWPKELND